MPCSLAAVSSSADHLLRPELSMNAPTASRAGNCLAFAEILTAVPSLSGLSAIWLSVALADDLPSVRARLWLSSFLLGPAQAVTVAGLVPAFERLVDALPGQERRQQPRQPAGVEALPAAGDLAWLPPPRGHIVLQLFLGPAAVDDFRPAGGHPGQDDHLMLQPPDAA